MSKKPTYYVAERQGLGASQMMQGYHRQAMSKRLRGGEFVFASMSSANGGAGSFHTEVGNTRECSALVASLTADSDKPKRSRCSAVGLALPRRIGLNASP